MESNYYIYHIPGKKIGVTKNLQRRVTDQQGYEAHEYEILDVSKDIDYISSREIELQMAYGYRVDTTPYKDLKPNKKTNMDINVTEQTTTFPCPVSKLKGQLLDNIGMEWSTDYGDIILSPKCIDWIMKNVKPSYYNDNRCFVYNKKLGSWSDKSENFDTIVKIPQKEAIRFNLIREWANERGLYDKGDVKTQYLKLMEEAGELGSAILKEDRKEIIDAVGDMVVVLTNLAHLAETTVEHCIDTAYAEIKNRKGKMINGTFVKQTL